MTDDSRAASMPKGVEPHDEAVEASPGSSAPADSDPSGESLAVAEPSAAEAPATAPRRPRTPFRIPDDDVARPDPVMRESEPPVARVSSSRPPGSAPPPSRPPQSEGSIIPVRIITINPPAPPPMQEPAGAEAVVELIAPRPPGVPDKDGGPDSGWNAEDHPTPVPFKAPEVMTSPTMRRPPAVVLAPPPGVPASARAGAVAPAPGPVSAPVRAPSLPPSAISVRPSSPALARSSVPVPPPAPLPASLAHLDGEAEPEAEEVRFDDETPTPALPDVMARRAEAPPAPAAPATPAVPGAPEAADTDGATEIEPELESVGDRRSEPGEAPEVSPEDMEVQSVPAPAVVTSLRPAPPKKPPPKVPLVIVPAGGTFSSPAVEVPGSKRKGRLWWEDFFNDDYIRTMEKVSDRQIEREVNFIEESLGVERGSALLDLACGTGRHAVELASRGYEMVGLDLSLAMLARAGDEAQDRGVKMNFVQGDMREMTFDEQFDAVFSWNTSFGYFEEEKNLAVVGRVHKALKTGGMFLLDVANRDFLTRQSPSLAWFEGDGCVCMDEMVVDFITSRMRVKRTMMLDDGRTREIEYSIRTYGLHELGKILHDSGFKVCEVSGRITTPGVYFGQESPRTIILAEKR
jgi:SAM-dependent methyltransferase